MISRALTMLSDERLAQLAAKGSDPAFSALYSRHSGTLFAYCRSITRNADDGWDALQNAMIKVFAMSRRALHIAAAGLATAAVSLSAAASSQGYTIGGSAWPGATVTYYSQARGYSGAVDRAARILNRAGVGVRLRSVPRAQAHVIVAFGGRPCEGDAAVGYQRLRLDILYLGRGCSSGLVTLTAVHEFGHVLGLDHETRVCARMNATFDDSGTPTRCKAHSLSYWLAHPLTSDDRRGLRAIYG